MTETGRQDQQAEQRQPEFRLPVRSVEGLAGTKRQVAVEQARNPVVSVDRGIGALRNQFVAECGQRRSFLWTPVLFAAGILLYGQLPREPTLPAIVLAAVLTAIVGAWRYRQNRTFRVWLAVALVAAGMAVAMLRVARLAGPMLDRPVFGTVEYRRARRPTAQDRAGRSGDRRTQGGSIA
ncbi:MAG TPA: hypothetical protein VK862_10625, partial [Afifellaceae bacterium]|nr:hypothetical protein [Afifellaceae bacterium]